MNVVKKIKIGKDPQDVRDIIKRLAGIFKPRDLRQVYEIVSEVFNLPEGGAFDMSLVPYLKEPLNFLNDRDTHMIVYVSPARAGKTITLIVGAFTYIITQDPADTLMVHITDKTANKFSKLTMNRTIDNSPEIKKLKSANKDDNNVLSKFFRNGMALIIGYPAPSQLAATDYKYVLITDSDRSPDDNGQGDWIKQADKRTQTYGSAGKTVLESSPSRDIIDPDWKRTTPHEAPPVAGILSWYNLGDRRLEYWTCPHCNEPFPLYPDMELFQLPPIEELVKELLRDGKSTVALKYSKIWCPNHGCEILEDERHEISQHTFWRKEFPDAPNNKIKSHWGSGYSAGFQTWNGLMNEYMSAVMYWSTTGDESKLRTFYNVDMGAPYKSIALDNKLTANELRDRAYDFGELTVPKGVRYLIANIDTQKWKWVVDIEGVGENNQRWIIDRFDVRHSKRMLEGQDGFEFVQPATYVEDWDEITEQVIDKTYPLGDGSGREMKIHHTVCDLQGTDGVTENAYKYARKLKYKLSLGDKFKLLRGERPNPKTNQPLFTLSVLDKTSKSAVNARVVGKLDFLRVNTTLGKDIVASQLRRTERGANYINFSKYLDSNVFDECTVEVRSAKGWENPLKKRNEQTDLLNYGLVNIAYIESKLPQNQLDWANPPLFASEWDTNVNIISEKGAENKKVKLESDRDRLIQSRSRVR